jgi:hypothetical protein
VSLTNFRFTGKMPVPRLLHDLESSALPVAGSGAGQQRADSLNRLPVATNNPANIRLPELHPEDRRFAGRNFRQHHLIRKLDQLTDNEFEELFHGPDCNHPPRFVTPPLCRVLAQFDFVF